MASQMKKDTGSYLSSSGVTAFIDIIRNLLMAHFLGPYNIGFFHTILTIPQTTQYFSLGATKTLPIIIPYEQSKKNFSYVAELKNSVLNFSILVSVLSFVLLCFYLTFHSLANRNQYLWTISAGSLILLWEIKSFLTTDYSTERRFIKLSGLEFLFTILVTAIQILGVPYIGAHAFWLGFIIPNLILIFIAGKDYLAKNNFIPFKINWVLLKKVFSLGILLNITSVTYNPFVITSRLFLAFTVGVKEVGFFLLSTIVISKISIIPSAIGKVILPKMSFLHGENGNSNDVYHLFLKAQIYTFILTFISVAIGLISIEPLTRLLLPDYLPGIPAAKIILWGCIPYCLIDNANNYLLACQKKKIFTYGLVLSFMMMLLLFGWHIFNKDITAFSICLSLTLTFCFYSFLSNFFVYISKKR